MTAANALATDKEATQPYMVQYLPPTSYQNCQLATAEEAYKYTILAEDFMVQTNLISTTVYDPEQYFEENIAPRITNDITISAPSVGLEVSGVDGATDLFLTFAERRLAYHVWDQARVCKSPDDEDMTKVYLREYGYVQNTDEGEGNGGIFNVFTTIELTFNGNLISRLVSTRRNTILDGDLGVLVSSFV